MLHTYRAPVGTAASLAGLLAFTLGVAGCQARGDDPPSHQVAHFSKDKSLIQPEGWETWVMVGSSTGLSYATPGAAPAAGAAPGLFHNVYTQPWAYREFMKSGIFPDGTMFVLSFYEASRKSAPAKAGFYEGDRLPNIDVHLKRAGIDTSGWAFYVFADRGAAGTKLPAEAACYSCHATEAAHDNVFTQFYPFVRERLAKH